MTAVLSQEEQAGRRHRAKIIAAVVIVGMAGFQALGWFSDRGADREASEFAASIEASLERLSPDEREEMATSVSLHGTASGVDALAAHAGGRPASRIAFPMPNVMSTAYEIESGVATRCVFVRIARDDVRTAIGGPTDRVCHPRAETEW